MGGYRSVFLRESGGCFLVFTCVASAKACWGAQAYIYAWLVVIVPHPTHLLSQFAVADFFFVRGFLKCEGGLLFEHLLPGAVACFFVTLCSKVLAMVSVVSCSCMLSLLLHLDHVCVMFVR